MTQRFYSNGKLLLTGEYVVLDGATALAIPTKKGQSLQVTPNDSGSIHWKSFDHQGKVWYTDRFTLEVLKEPIDPLTKTLWTLLQKARALNPDFLNSDLGFEVEAHLDFARDWGLGSSSTLINNIAQWAEVDPYKLLAETFGGSGYDIAAAQHDAPILYEKCNGAPTIREITLPWDFTASLFFVHRNNKQNSRDGIQRYQNNPATKQQISQLSDISNKMLLCYTLSDFEALLRAHEAHISNIIQLPPIKDELFSDYTGCVKSLGAWGGDFILATGDPSKYRYFQQKGYDTILPFEEMIL
ncbi:MAG: GYDIA family GHMP kinase [Marinirhabdus sp.]|nr:GYDIA family GHMP kinase [Marinirhabdus sp.]